MWYKEPSVAKVSSESFTMTYLREEVVVRVVLEVRVVVDSSFSTLFSVRVAEAERVVVLLVTPLLVVRLLLALRVVLLLGVVPV